jgi:hypothetical protein
VREVDVDVDEGAVKVCGSSEANVLEIGKGLFLPCACAAARSAFIELIGSAGSIADIGIPAACTAARIAALLALFD